MNTPTPETDAPLSTTDSKQFEEMRERSRKLERERDHARATNIKWALGVEQSSTDIVDMQRDEFKRIRALCHQTGVRGQEIQGICNRAIAVIEQTVPVIVQRDKFQQEAQQYRGLLYGCDKHKLWQGLSCIGCIEAERDQLRKVCDELAKVCEDFPSAVGNCETGEHWVPVEHWEEYAEKNNAALSSYNSLPHVIAAKKGNEE